MIIQPTAFDLQERDGCDSLAITQILLDLFCGTTYVCASLGSHFIAWIFQAVFRELI